MSAPLSQIYGLTVNIDKSTVPLAVLNQSPPLSYNGCSLSLYVHVFKYMEVLKVSRE